MRILCALVALAALSLNAACQSEGCLRGEEGCEIPSPCTEVEFQCEDPFVEVFVIQPGDPIPGGIDAIAGVGDVVLRNRQITVVIDAIDNPNLASPSGGTIIDMSTTGDDNDTLNQIFHATGALSEDWANYTSMRIIEGADFVAVQVSGHLFGDETRPIHSRYELRACDRGVRVRTEQINNSGDDFAWTVGDGWYWGNRQHIPFAPARGRGYQHEPFGLSGLTDAITEMPYFVASSHTTVSSAVATIGCTHDTIGALHSGQVSFSGPLLEVATPGDFLVYERMHFVGAGKGLAPASDLVLEARRQLRGAPVATIRGQVSADDNTRISDENRVAVHISQGLESDPPELRTPITVVSPGPDGAWSARVPQGADYVLDYVAFGEVVATESVAVDGDISVEARELPAAGRLRVNVEVDNAPGRAQLFLYPADDETAARTSHAFVGVSTICPVLLGYQFGDSPACNRVLVDETQVFDLPAGEYFVFATIGPFGSLARERVSILGGDDVEIDVDLDHLDGVLPTGALSADFHVHGGKSFDTAIPDLSRVLSFVTQDVDVIAATDHDAIHDYSATVDALGVTSEDLIIINGLETTPFILKKMNPDVTFPIVIGHWNFWPTEYQPSAPRGGAPSDELDEPGVIFNRVSAAGLPAHGVIQMNHPWSDADFGRDLGWPRALRLTMFDEIPVFDDGTAKGIFGRRPPGSSFSNLDYHTQEVMNGTSNGEFLAHRAVWFWLLNQGILKGGTANSDSHTLTDNVLGTPRTLVFTDAQMGPDFDVVSFNRDVKAGRMVGTNGPVIDARIERRDIGVSVGPSLSSFIPARNDVLRIRVTAAPWVDVDEIRVIVNGEVVRTIRENITNAPNRFGTGDTLRFEGELVLNSVLPDDGRDSWLIIEAGAAVPIAGDLDCDGVPDTSDNNDDGVVDFRDVEGQEDLEEPPAACEGGIGPFRRSVDPPPVDDGRFGFFAVTPGGYPLAFTNPFILDRDGNGFAGPGLPDPPGGAQ